MRILLFLMLAASTSAQNPRNIVVILADDMGLASLHAEHPGSGLPTVNLDRLRSEGMSFTDAHSPSAVCSPTRYALLTGRYSWRSRLKSGIVGKWERPLIAEDRLTIADLAGSANRHSACIGKWHLGWRWPKQGGGVTTKSAEIDYTQPIGGGALEAGFDHYFGDDVPNWPPYVWIEDDRALTVPEAMQPSGKVIGVSPGPMVENWNLEAVLPEITRRCVRYIRDRAKEEEPFLLYFPMTSPHTPITPSAAFLGQSGVSLYADFLLETDWCVGQVLRALEQFGVADDTLVIFTCDNGTSNKALFDKLKAGGVDLRANWRGHKADVWEGGHRVPFLVRWPGVVEPDSSCEVPICLTDIFATTAEAFGVETGEGAGEDSASLLPLFRGEEREGVHGGAIINHSGSGGFALRDGKWKLCFCPGSAGWSYPNNTKQAEKLGLPPVQLYDMDADPGELKNLALELPEKVEELTARFRSIVEASPNDPPTWWGRLPWPKPGE